jgi:hypothetical protein
MRGPLPSLVALALSACAAVSPAATVQGVTPDQLAAVQVQVTALQATVAALPAPVDLTPTNSAIADLQAAVASIPAAPDLTPYAKTAQVAAMQTQINGMQASFVAAAVAATPLALDVVTWAFTVGVPVIYGPQLNGGSAPFTVTEDGLPPGMTADAGGGLSGTPTTAGTGSATITARDATGATATVQQPWTVSPATIPAPVIGQ